MRPYQYHAVFGTQQKRSVKCTDSNPVSVATTRLTTVSKTLVNKSGRTQWMPVLAFTVEKEGMGMEMCTY
jgi:hypothetical protein